MPIEQVKKFFGLKETRKILEPESTCNICSSHGGRYGNVSLRQIVEVLSPHSIIVGTVVGPNGNLILDRFLSLEDINKANINSSRRGVTNSIIWKP